MKCFFFYISDITINDFANSSVCKNRIKKSSTSVTHALKKLEINDKAWDEKDLEDFDFVPEENEDGTVSFVTKTVECRKKKAASEDQTRDQGNEYPLDVWYLISDYVRPEDVGRFAGICKISRAVVQTAKFWFGLYKRYYINVKNLPERLQPECMYRLFGVRTSVIRALHYVYPPFVGRSKKIRTFEHHPDVLLRRQCVLMWYEKKKKFWYYYFKLKEPTSPVSCYDKHKQDLMELLEDVSANIEENCRILQVVCLSFVPVPLVQGLTLQSTSLTLSKGFTRHRLQLVFGSGIRSTVSYITDGSSCGTILLDPVIDVKVLNWWHPRYPYDHNIELLLCQE